MSEYVREVNERDFDQVVLKSKTPVLVDFSAEWCGPCRTLAPIIEAVAEQYGEAAQVFQLNVDDSPAVAQRYGIQEIPILILFPCSVLMASGYHFHRIEIMEIRDRPMCL